MDWASSRPCFSACPSAYTHQMHAPTCCYISLLGKQVVSGASYFDSMAQSKAAWGQANILWRICVYAPSNTDLKLLEVGPTDIIGARDYMRHRNKQFCGAYRLSCTTEFKEFCGAMRHRINLVKHTLLDAPLNVCLWIASFLVVCDRWNPGLQLL
jgi:hypothetical protein